MILRFDGDMGFVSLVYKIRNKILSCCLFFVNLL